MNKILIIDDDRELCALIKHSVQSEHIEADFCNTGKEGLQKLKEQEYQLVILDVMMPGRLGKRYAARIDYTLEPMQQRNFNFSYMFQYNDINIYEEGERAYNTTYKYHLRSEGVV